MILIVNASKNRKMSLKDSTTMYFSEPEEVLNWKGTYEGSSDGALAHLKRDCSAKRKRNSDPKSLPKEGNGTGRRRKHLDTDVDDMEQCAKRMKWMSLQNVSSPKTKETNPFDIDTGYEGDCEA